MVSRAEGNDEISTRGMSNAAAEMADEISVVTVDSAMIHGAHTESVVVGAGPLGTLTTRAP